MFAVWTSLSAVRFTVVHFTSEDKIHTLTVSHSELIFGLSFFWIKITDSEIVQFKVLYQMQIHIYLHKETFNTACFAIWRRRHP